MQKKITILSLLLALLSFPLYAQDDVIDVAPAAEDELPDASIDVDLAFVSNYVFRGTDLYTNRAQQEKKAVGEHTGALSFQPSININTPVEGLYFNLWGNFAMEGRSDQDVDQRLQTGPDTTAVTPGAAQTTYSTATVGDYLGQNAEAGTLPGYYNELNGLDRLDELDLTIGYGADTKVGTIGFGFVSYQQPNTKAKAGFALNEVFVSYALPFLTDLSLSLYSDIASSNQYYNLGYGSGVDIADGISLDYGVGVGYGVKADLKGIQDVTGSVGVTLYGFSVAYNFSVRPDLRFHDGDAAGGASAQWINGGSTNADGLTEDFSQKYGVNEVIKSTVQSALEVGNSNFVYTPRSKIPRMVWWVSAGYSFSI
ncbi:MAG: hypothetical protein RIF32_06255 [Leptospirales bacterium]|jgi:hypothetical protein